MTTEKTNLRSTRWGPNTLNNYTQEDINLLLEYFSTECSFFLMQEEVGESGTPHLQFCFMIKGNSKKSLRQMKKIHPGVHWEISKKWVATVNYCKKEDSRKEGGSRWCSVVEDECDEIEDPLKGVAYYKFQQYLVDLFKTKPDNRTIYWVYDKHGGCGKTSFGKHIVLNNPRSAIYLTNGGGKDLKYVISEFISNKKNKIRIVMLNLTRTTEDRTNYQFLEEIKDGIFTTMKYESKMVVMNPVHLVVFSNFEPDEYSMSLDRYQILNIKRSKPVQENKILPSIEFIEDF